jgi:proteasome accessory factor B
MQKFKPQYRRLLFIDRRIKERGYPNCVALAAEWEVSEKTIQRDLDYLRDELDAPIAYDPVKHGYYYTETRFSLPAMSVSESDLFSVCVAQNVLSQFRNTPLFQRLSSIFEKIRDSLPDKTLVHPSWMHDRILVFPEPATLVDSDVWNTLAKAIRDNRRVRIVHRSPTQRKEPTDPRCIDPYYLVNHRGEWYVNGYCHYRKAIRTFAVSRISSATVLDDVFTMPAGMTRERMFGDTLGIIWKEQFHTVRVRFSPDVAPYIRERQWHPRQRIVNARDGGLVIQFKTNHLHEVSDWVLSWGSAATVLAPPLLVQRISETLARAAANYRRPTNPV